MNAAPLRHRRRVIRDEGPNPIDVYVGMGQRRQRGRECHSHGRPSWQTGEQSVLSAKPSLIRQPSVTRSSIQEHAALPRNTQHDECSSNQEKNPPLGAPRQLACE